jgi:hypothetical protein
MAQDKDFRSERMESPEGRGRARRAWDAYAKRAVKIAGPPAAPIIRRVAAPMGVDLIGFWLTWHLEGGFEGMRRLGMSRASIYRRISRFRRTTGKHPDEFELPGVTLDLRAYLEDQRFIARMIGD